MANVIFNLLKGAPYEWRETHHWYARCVAQKHDGGQCTRRAYRSRKPNDRMPPLCEQHRDDRDAR